RHYVDPVRNKKGKIIKAGYWVGKVAASYNSLYNPYLNDNPAPSPARFWFTPYINDSCSVSGIDPKVQIRSGDLKVTGGIDTSVRLMPDGVGEFEGESFGSNAEYGVLSGGINSRMASGS